MNLLFVVAKYPTNNTFVNIFVKEQYEELKKNFPDVNYKLYNVETNLNKLNYFLKREDFRRYIKDNDIDIVHYHYGLTVLVGMYQNIKAKQIVTFHGDDINIKTQRLISQRAISNVDYSIFVNNKLSKQVNVNNYSVIPCGCDSGQFKPMDMLECRRILNLDEKKKIILYVGNKNVPVKNYSLFRKTMEMLKKSSSGFNEMELMNVRRNDVPLYLNAADVIVLTSLNEGSPQVIKEAAFCRRPIVTSNVGDVQNILKGSNNSHIINSYNPVEYVNAIKNAILNKTNTGFLNLQEYENNFISNKIIEIYKKLI